MKSKNGRMTNFGLLLLPPHLLLLLPLLLLLALLLLLLPRLLQLLPLPQLMLMLILMLMLMLKLMPLLRLPLPLPPPTRKFSNCPALPCPNPPVAVSTPSSKPISLILYPASSTVRVALVAA